MKLCPRCGSGNVEMSKTGVLGITPMNDLCGKCGYKGIFPDVDDVKEFKRRLNEKRKKN